MIDSLVRKPGAFAHYRYREDLFPTSRFRMAYDRLCDGPGERAGAKEYLRILRHAARDGEAAVDDALRVLLARDSPLSSAAVIALARTSAELPAAITDDAQLIEALGHAVYVVLGSPLNFKITTKDDLDLADGVMKSRASKPKPTPMARFDEEAKW